MHEIYLCHDEENQKFLAKYRSPTNEASTFKGIPMDKFSKFLNLVPSKNRRLKYRGTSKPGFVRPQSNTIKGYADTFAVYYDNQSVLHLGAPNARA